MFLFLTADLRLHIWKLFSKLAPYLLSRVTRRPAGNGATTLALTRSFRQFARRVVFRNLQNASTISAPRKLAARRKDLRTRADVWTDSLETDSSAVRLTVQLELLDTAKLASLVRDSSINSPSIF